MSKTSEETAGGTRSEGRRPRAVYVGKTRIPHPVPEDLCRKHKILTEHLRAVLVVVGRTGIRSNMGTSLVVLPELPLSALSALFFYSVAPVLAVLIAAGKQPSAVVAQSPYEGYIAEVVVRLCPRRWRPRIVVEVHGDPGTATRLYGSSVRRILSPLADKISRNAIMGADRVRVIGSYTRSIVEETGYDGPIDEHIAFSDFNVFLDAPSVPMPDEPCAVYVGVLERYKAPDVLIEAWSIVHSHRPDAHLSILGEGPMREVLERRAQELGIDGSISFEGRVPRPSVSSYLDRSRFLILPSRSEGLGLVIIEAMSRARPVVATDVGGISELVKDGITGILVTPDDVDALSAGILRILNNPNLAGRLGAAGRREAERRDPLREFEAGTRRLAEWIDHGG